MIDAQAAIDVGEIVGWAGLGDLGLGGLVVLGVVLLGTGRLIPKSTADARVADKDAQLAAERAEKAAALKLNAENTGIIREQADTIRDLSIAAQVGVRVGEHVHRLADEQAGT